MRQKKGKKLRITFPKEAASTGMQSGVVVDHFPLLDNPYSVLRNVFICTSRLLSPPRLEPRVLPAEASALFA